MPNDVQGCRLGNRKITSTGVNINLIVSRVFSCFLFSTYLFLGRGSKLASIAYKLRMLLFFGLKSCCTSAKAPLNLETCY